MWDITNEKETSGRMTEAVTAACGYEVTVAVEQVIHAMLVD